MLAGDRIEMTDEFVTSASLSFCAHSSGDAEKSLVLRRICPLSAETLSTPRGPED